MSSNINHYANINKFLQGRLSDEECAGFLQSLQNTPELQQHLDEESFFEAVFYSEQWLESVSPLKRDLSQWFSSVVPLSSIEKELKTGDTDTTDYQLFSHDKWQKIVNNAFDKAYPPVKPTFFLPFFSRNSKSVITIISIILIASITLFYNLRNSPTHQVTPDTFETADIFRDKDQQEYAFNDSLKQEGFEDAESISVFDTIKEYCAADAVPSHIILPAQKKGVVYLSKNSGFLAENNADVTIISNTDSVVTLSMIKCSAVFTVKKNMYKRFVVITPHVEVRVVGTIFRVAVAPLKTDISVVEGEVTITTIQGTQEILSLRKGKTAYVSQELQIKDIIAKSRTLKHRENFLKSYLQYMHKSRLEQFSTDLIFDTLQIKEQTLLDSLLHFPDPVIKAQLMHYKVAHNNEKSHFYKKSTDHFLQLYKERQNECIAQLALLRVCLLNIHNSPYKRSLDYLEKYIDDFTDGFALKEVMALHIRTCLAERDYERAIPYMVQFIQQFPHTHFSDHIAFNLAQIFRQQTNDLSNALKYYELVITDFINSPYHEDAMYWAGWCIIQQRLPKKGNEFFKQYKKNYPDGTWRGVISEK